MQNEQVDWDFLKTCVLFGSVALNIWCAHIVCEAAKLIKRTRTLLASLIVEDACDPEAGGGGA